MPERLALGTSDVPRHPRSVPRPGPVPRHLRRRDPRQWWVDLHRGAQCEHAQRAEHSHREPGRRRPDLDTGVGSVHRDHLHAARMAVRRADMSLERVPMLHVARCVCVHLHRLESGPVRGHRAPAESPQVVASLSDGERRRRHLDALHPALHTSRRRFAH